MSDGCEVRLYMIIPSMQRCVAMWGSLFSYIMQKNKILLHFWSNSTITIIIILNLKFTNIREIKLVVLMTVFSVVIPR